VVTAPPNHEPAIGCVDAALLSPSPVLLRISGCDRCGPTPAARTTGRSGRCPRAATPVRASTYAPDTAAPRPCRAEAPAVRLRTGAGHADPLRRRTHRRHRPSRSRFRRGWQHGSGHGDHPHRPPSPLVRRRPTPPTVTNEPQQSQRGRGRAGPNDLVPRFETGSTQAWFVTRDAPRAVAPAAGPSVQESPDDLVTGSLIPGRRPRSEWGHGRGGERTGDRSLAGKRIRPGPKPRSGLQGGRGRDRTCDRSLVRRELSR
jgi:hypothetical protein